MVDIRIKELYHGTTKEGAKSILNMGFNLPKWNFNKTSFQKKPGTLGYGVYAFSQIYVCKKYIFEKIRSETAVVLIRLNLENMNIVDLTNEEHNEIYQKFRERFMNLPIFKSLCRELRNGNQSELEGIMLEYLIKYHSEDFFGFDQCDCVKSWTVSVLSDTMNSNVPNALEYCIRNVQKIKEVELWKEG